MDSIMNPTLGQQCTARDVEVAFFDSYQEAKDYAFSQYWVKPVYFTCEEREKLHDRFNSRYRVCNWSTCGLVHYVKR